MSKKQSNGGNGDALTDEQVAILNDNQIAYDPASNDCYDSEGNLLSPGVVAALINMDENPPSGSAWGKGMDALNLGRPSTPNAQRTSPPEHPGVGVPPEPFVAPGTDVDRDGSYGATPSEMLSEGPDPAAVDTSGTQLTRFGAPMAQQLAQARQAGDQIMANAPKPGDYALTPPGPVAVNSPDTVKVHRDAPSGQYAGAPGGRDHVAGHEVAVHSLGQPGTADALIRTGDRQAPSQPNGPAPGPGVRSVVGPTIRQVPPEETRGGEL